MVGRRGESEKKWYLQLQRGFALFPGYCCDRVRNFQSIITDSLDISMGMCTGKWVHSRVVQLYILLQILDPQRALCIVGHRSPRDQRKSDRVRINAMRDNNRLQIRFVACSAFS